MRRAFEAANRIGDLTVAAYSCDALNTNLLAAGDPLPEVQRETENGLQFAQKARFGRVIDVITAQLGLIRTLRGLTPKFGSFDEGQFKELRFERHLANYPALALPECWYWIRKLQARFFAGDYAFIPRRERGRTSYRGMLACGSLHYPRSERPGGCSLSRLPRTSGRRVVAASDGRGRKAGIRADLVPAWEPGD